MDRYTAAAIGNNLSGALSSIGEMFDPRLRAQADQQRLTNEGIGLKNQGFAIDNQYAPKVYDSNIALTNERAGTERSQQAMYGAQTKNWDTRNQALSDLYASAGLGGFVKKFEGFNPNAYADGAQTSIGYGTRARPGETSITQEEAQSRLNQELSSHAARVDGAIGKYSLNLTPQQRDAMISFDYNTGRGPDLLQRFGNNPDALTAKMLEYTKFQGKDLAGLQKRRAAEVDLFRSAVLSSVAGGGGDPQQLTNALNTAKAADIFYNPSSSPDDIRRGQAAVGVANPGFNTVAGTTAETIKVNDPKLRSDEAIAAGNAQTKLLGDLFAPAGGTRRGDGSMLQVPKTAPNSFNDQQKVNEMAQAASFKVFNVPVDEDGAPIEDPYAPTRRAWSQSYSNAMGVGMSPIEAEAAANIHHFGTDQPEINSEDTFRFGFGKDPSLPAITNTDPLQASSVFGAQDPAQLATVAAAVPGLFGLPVQTPGISNSGAAVTGVEDSAQPSNSAPAQPAAELAKPLRASDQFKAREGSAERKERESKEKEIASLESDIQNVVKSLQSGEVTLAQAYTPNPQKVKLSDDSYNRTLNRLKEMESRLEKLKGGGVQTGQTATGQQTIRRYNPATGAIE
jgi:GH24 family phage-related lysozyme (muramidase)